MWRSILAWSLICACVGTGVVAFFHGLMTIGQAFTETGYPTFWHFALGVGITAALTAASIGFGIAADAVDKGSV